MTPRRHLAWAAGLLALGAAGLVIYSGGLTVPRPGRAALTGSRAAMHGELERLESATPAGRPGDDRPWRAYLDALEKEREHGRLDVAIRVLSDAYGAALASRSWEGMIAVGDAILATERAPGNAAGARMNARQAYLTALIRARRDRSVEGALRSAAAFRALGDRDAVEQCLHVAALLATRDAPATQRVHEARQRWAAREPLAEF